MSLEPGDEFGLDDVVSGSTAHVMLLACKRLFAESLKNRGIVSWASLL